MTPTSITSPEGELLNLIERLGDLAWRRYEQRYPMVQVGAGFERADHSAYPPVISFRFVRESSQAIARLKAAVESYVCGIEWTMTGRPRIGLPGINWVIWPKRVYELREVAANMGISPSTYFSQQEPGFGPIAHEDMTGLVEHVRKSLLFEN